VSEERHEPPDIDVDFEHERREIVMQWIFEQYGRDHAALCSTVIRYRTKGAIRDVGKALGLTEDLIKMLSSQVWGWSEDGVEDKHVQELNLNLSDRRLRLALDLARQLMGAPRHLSQHPGGFVLTNDRLDDLVPIEPAAMIDRQVIEWDKDDVDALKFMKVDVFIGMSATPFDLEAPLGERRAIIRRDGEDVEMVGAAWGLRPGPNADRPCTVIRAEGRTVSSHRCLVPASEFRLRNRSRTYSFRLADGDWFYFPGIWRPAKPDWPQAYAILTIDANADIACYHDRQMAVLRRGQRLDWLDSLVPEDELLRPLPVGSFRVNEVRPAFA
jgi:putative SOS response-associated peptidase YedK